MVSNFFKKKMKELDNLTIQTKLQMVGVGGVALTLIILISVNVWQNAIFSRETIVDIEYLYNEDLDHITEGVYNLVHALDEAIRKRINDNLKVAHYVLNQNGLIGLSSQQIEWQAVNQFTRDTVSVTLPKMVLGDNWIGQNYDFDKKTPVVDDVTKLVGGTAAIFQRINERGDMLRVATDVKKLDGQRAIGSFIPAIDPDPIGKSLPTSHPGGTPNPVVSALMRGEVYRGLSYVVNDWYLTAYEPIFDNNGGVIGALYIGITQESISTLREAILDVKVGKTGYVFVLEGKGEARGSYIISRNGERDGENIWDSQDADGLFFIQSIVSKAIVLKEGEFATERYAWQNPKELEPRWKITRIAYYEPWNWVIGVSAYEDDFQEAFARLKKRELRMILILTLVGTLLTLCIGYFTWIIAKGILAPLVQLGQAATCLSVGDFSQKIRFEGHGEMATLFGSFHRMSDYLIVRNERIQRISNGDLRTDLTLDPDHDAIGSGLSQIIENLREWVRIAARNSQDLRNASLMLSEAVQDIREAAKTDTRISLILSKRGKGTEKAAQLIEGVIREMNLLAKNAATQLADKFSREIREKSEMVDVRKMLAQANRRVENISEAIVHMEKSARYLVQMINEATIQTESNQKISTDDQALLENPLGRITEATESISRSAETFRHIVGQFKLPTDDSKEDFQ
ncbi:MAG: hypothetical protein B6244_13695 [Candidatus Cloacimonetes bacterium 4572_55]|nr:MAG: hypothetical protein B6244_13695 [Candidatus Cloacimonetes bacterium 4572_55]